ncbi:hypothetical protein [Parafilimonas sp.]|uniref:hypothetical protein n=1 Tax=Parafilimonas sp. TaxID=1969739 RepID=UPI0039E6A430
MERNEILKSVGFSEKFLQALQEFEKAVPNVYYEVPFEENVTDLNMLDTSGQMTINQASDNYNHNIIVKQL